MKHKNQPTTGRRFFYAVEAPLTPGRLSPKVGVYQLSEPNAALFHAIGGQGPKIHVGSFVSSNADPLDAFQVTVSTAGQLVAEWNGSRVFLSPAAFASCWHVSTVPALVARLGRQTVVTYTHEDGRVEVLTSPDYVEPAAVVLNWPKMAGKVFRLAEVPADRQKAKAPLLEGILQHTATAGLECGPGDGVPLDKWRDNFFATHPTWSPKPEVGKGSGEEDPDEKLSNAEWLERYAAGVRVFIEQCGPGGSAEEDLEDQGREEFDQFQAYESYCHEQANQGLEPLDHADWLEQRGEDNG